MQKVSPWIILITLLLPSLIFATTTTDKEGTTDVPTDSRPPQIATLHRLHDQQMLVAKPSFALSVKRNVRINVPKYRQQRALSCECAATHAAATYQGYDLSEEACLKLVEVHEGSKSNGVWGDPDEKFVGNVNARQRNYSGYGVYARPLERGLESANIPAESSYNTPLPTLLATLANGNPVVAWTPYAVGNCWRTSWKTPEGKDVDTCLNEHALVITGFTGSINNPEKIFIMDVHPGMYREVSVNQFLKAWDALDRMALVIY